MYSITAVLLYVLSIIKSFSFSVYLLVRTVGVNSIVVRDFPSILEVCLETPHFPSVFFLVFSILKDSDDTAPEVAMAEVEMGKCRWRLVMML